MDCLLKYFFDIWKGFSLEGESSYVWECYIENNGHQIELAHMSNGCTIILS
jgi:hypothetical protein